MSRIRIFPLCLFALLVVQAAQAELPLKEWSGKGATKPLVFYISGDGGWNSFSTDLCETIHKAGYDVVSLDARSYFWDRKTPEETANAIASYLEKRLRNRTNDELLLIGYSFGADVMPFIINHFPPSLHIKTTYLLAPSTSTDFEVHWSDILGGNKKRSMDVVAEINHMPDVSLVIITGSDETRFPFSAITLRRYTREVLPGGHHFSRDTDEITSVILKHAR